MVTAPTTDEEMRDWLVSLIYDAMDESGDKTVATLRIDTFAEAGLLTINEGLVLSFREGSEYQLTTLRSR